MARRRAQGWAQSQSRAQYQVRSGAGLLAALLLSTACAREPAPPPNVLLLVVDTLRADALGTYGYERATSPQIDTLLANRGVVIDRAYADAPWTLPSMAAMLTGHPSSDLTDAAGSPIGIPETAETLAELLGAAGYTTAAFVTNATMDGHNGYAQGFDHYQTPPLQEALRHHAGQVTDEALTYLRKRPDPQKPFFLWLHYLDPHDPYEPADLKDGKTPFDPDYRGEITGGDTHGLELGRLELQSPADDIRHLRALYDSEVRFVDEQIGRLLDEVANLDPDALSNTLVILTSDHGEEFYEHRGFKHGQTLYEEALRVPWIWRWDAHLPAGRRVAGPASLLDLVPTTLSALGLPPRDGVSGIDLLSLLRGESPSSESLETLLTHRQLFFRHLAPGPERFATLRGVHKEIVFDREAPFQAGDGRGDALWHHDVERLQRSEVYDLAVDPHETRPLKSGNSTEAFCRLDPWLGGLRVLRPATDDPGAEVWTVRLVSPSPGSSASPSSKIRPLFLGKQDELIVETVGDRSVITLRLEPDRLPKGVLLTEHPGPIDIEVTTASGRQVRQETQLDLRGLREEDCSSALGDGGDDGDGDIALWWRAPRRPFGDGEMTDEQKEALEALGYLEPSQH